jgi:hypothetical protein
MSMDWKRSVRATAGVVMLIGVVGTAAGEVSPDGSAETGVAEESGASWPTEIIDRPLTLPEGWLSAGASFAASSDLSTVGSAATGLWGVSYGVTGDLSVGLGYALALREFERRGPLDLNAGYTFLVAGPLTLTATGSYSHDFMTGGDQLATGAMMWLMLGDRLALISPGGQIGYAIEDSALTASAPIALGFQASSRVFAQLGVELAEIGVANSETTLFGADQTALELAVFATPVPSIDIGASVGADPKNDLGDTATFGVVVMVNRALRR